MKTLFSLSVIMVLTFSGAWSQCLTDFSKLLPEPSIDYSLAFGKSISMNGDYLAVSVPNSDSLGRLTGIVFIYQKAEGGWKKVAAAAPSDPVDGLQFGENVKLSNDYLLVTAAANGGSLYVFKKPVGGWTSQTEIVKFTVPNTVRFGGIFSNTVDIAADQQTIVIADPYYDPYTPQFSKSGALFVYHKNPAEEWNAGIIPVRIDAPETDVQDFGRTGVHIEGNRILTGTPYAPTANGQLYLYHDASGEFKNFTLEARLATEQNSAWLGMYNMTFNSDGIFTSAIMQIDNVPRLTLLYYQQPPGGWLDTDQPTCMIDPDGSTQISNEGPIYFSNNHGPDLYVSSRDGSGKGYFTKLSKGVQGWCEPVYETIDVHIPSDDPTVTNRYGSINAASDNGTAVVGYAALPENKYAQVALKAFSRDVSGNWENTLIYSPAKSTAGHSYGSKVLGFEDYLFVSASHDGSVKSDVGAVYVYQKNGKEWNKISKILPEVNNAYDDVFGSALASNGNYLAVGALGWEPHGRVFVYKKNTDGWASPSLVQEIRIPEDQHTVYGYGDNVAMNDEWLIIPFVDNGGSAVIKLAAYRFNGDTWDYDHAVLAGRANIFSRSSTLGVAMDDEILLAGSTIFELNAEEKWEAHYTLYPSDYEPIQIAPDFSHWVSNGASFGHAVAIDNDRIFISAPTRDYQGIWDVGAVYVYTRLPGRPWSSKSETAKIVPRLKEESGLFGYSIKPFQNTLIAGAPGGDTYARTGVARNKPGRAFVVQSTDYFWQDVIDLIDFTGDTFVKDYFGLDVGMDESDFFIAASLEDIDHGKLSGSVYVTEAPPVIKLVPPVCNTETTIDLFGYPFGGTWSGPGIIDAQEGTFDPKIAGTGVHEFTYETPSCHYTGKLRIEVQEPPNVTLDVNPHILVCANTQNISIPLRVQYNSNDRYLWHYRATPTDNFTSLELRSNIMYATQRGEYQVRVSNETCTAWAPIIKVENEIIDVQITSIPPVCDPQSLVSLNATPAGGFWHGPGVTGDKLNVRNLPNGSHTVYYDYTSPTSCIFKESALVEVEKLTPPQVMRVSGNLCKEGAVVLETQETQPPNVTYTWNRKGPDDNTYHTVGENSPTLETADRGGYTVRVSKENCQLESAPVKIDDQLTVTFTPTERVLELCSGETRTLSFAARAGASYEWYYAETPGHFERIGEDTHVIQPERNGYYKGLVRQGVCSFTSDIREIIILPRDSVFIPNIFTPNGDGPNDVFKVYLIEGSTQDSEISYTIINQYGREVFNTNHNQPWTDEDFPKGVYFWLARFATCEGKLQAFKGWVHLVR